MAETKEVGATVPKTEVTREDLMGIAEEMVKQSGGKLRLAFNEDDKSSEKDLEAAHFLKLNEKRMGRDIEVYDLMVFVSPQQGLADFCELVIMVKDECPESYNAGSKMLKELGLKVFPEKMHSLWIRIFE